MRSNTYVRSWNTSHVHSSFSSGVRAIPWLRLAVRRSSAGTSASTRRTTFRAGTSATSNPMRVSTLAYSRVPSFERAIGRGASDVGISPTSLCPTASAISTW